MNIIKIVSGLGVMGILGIILWVSLQLNGILYFTFWIGIISTLTLVWLSQVYNKENGKE